MIFHLPYWVAVKPLAKGIEDSWAVRCRWTKKVHLHRIHWTDSVQWAFHITTRRKTTNLPSGCTSVLWLSKKIWNLHTARVGTSIAILDNYKKRQTSPWLKSSFIQMTWVTQKNNISTYMTSDCVRNESKNIYYKTIPLGELKAVLRKHSDLS